MDKLFFEYQKGNLIKVGANIHEVKKVKGYFIVTAENKVIDSEYITPLKISNNQLKKLGFKIDRPYHKNANKALCMHIKGRDLYELNGEVVVYNKRNNSYSVLKYIHEVQNIITQLNAFEKYPEK